MIRVRRFVFKALRVELFLPFPVCPSFLKNIHFPAACPEGQVAR